TTRSKPCLIRFFQASDNVWGRARSSNPHNHIILVNTKFFQIFPGLLFVILCKFHSLTNCNISSGNQTDNPVKRNAKSKWTLRGIQYAQPSTGTGTYLKKPSS